MGNSPSRDDNDPLPKSSSNSSSSNGGSAGNTDLEADEKARPPLSQSNHQRTRLTTNESRKESKNNVSTYSTSPAIDISNVTSQKNIKQNHNYLEAPKKQSKKQTLTSSPNSDFDFDLEIGMSMAKLLRSQQDEDISGSSSFSSGESKSSSTLCSSGAFNKDEDTSMSSSNSSPATANKFYLKEESKEMVSLNKLDAIAEMNSLESTPEPRRKASDNPLEKASLSRDNLKKHGKTNATLTKNVSSSSSTVSSSLPTVHTSRKLDLDIDEIIDRLLRIGIKRSSSKKDKLPVLEHEIKYILSKSRSIFLDQPTLLRLSPPVKVVGDVHGQFHDLIRIFNCCGYPPYSNYLFLGDYVDRGYKSLETILLLLCYKIKYPENFFMLRGNHESANITKIYGFYDECKRRLTNRKLWKNFIDVFNTLPIAATINDKIFCVHGGLSPDLQDLKNIEQIKRPTDVPDRGLLADLLWSDPDPSIKNFSLTWPKNDRGVSYCFGRKHVDYFCQQFRMDLVVRGHMVVEDGYEFFNKRRLVTIFSAPNYCGEFNNFGAIMSVDKNLYCSFELIKPN